MDQLTDVERRLIAEAVAKGRVRRVEGSGDAKIVYEDGTLKYEGNEGRRFWRQQMTYSFKKMKVRANIVARRRAAGESIADIAKDLGISEERARLDLKNASFQPIPKEALEKFMEKVEKAAVNFEKITDLASSLGTSQDTVKSRFNMANAPERYAAVLETLKENREKSLNERARKVAELIRKKKRVSEICSALGITDHQYRLSRARAERMGF